MKRNCVDDDVWLTLLECLATGELTGLLAPGTASGGPLLTFLAK